VYAGRMEGICRGRRGWEPFIVVTLAILVAGVFIIGSKQYLFSSTYQLKAQFDNVVGLDAGADVRVGGVHSGTVSSIVLPTNRAKR
jgi:phospholipid/cholesterol/gamma-HCH transport system substrate-binding protein